MSLCLHVGVQRPAITSIQIVSVLTRRCLCVSTLVGGGQLFGKIRESDVSLRLRLSGELIRVVHVFLLLLLVVVVHAQSLALRHQ